LAYFLAIAARSPVRFRAVRAISRGGRHTRAERSLGPARPDEIAPKDALEAVRPGLEGGTLENARTV